MILGDKDLMPAGDGSSHVAGTRWWCSVFQAAVDFAICAALAPRGLPWDCTGY